MKDTKADGTGRICRRCLTRDMLGQEEYFVNLRSYIDNLDADKIIEILRKMVPNGNGEIFFMDNEECPMMYPSGGNSPDFYKTLEIARYF